MPLASRHNELDLSGRFVISLTKCAFQAQVYRREIRKGKYMRAQERGYFRAPKNL
jgi:hypothetical protein